MKFHDLLNDPTITQFCNDLSAIFEGQLSLHQKAKAIGANIKLFLNSRSYAISEARSECLGSTNYRVPYPIRVKIQVDNVDLYGAFPRNVESPNGSPFRTAVQNGMTIFVEGAEELFKQQPELQELCEYCAQQLSVVINQSKRLPEAAPSDNNGHKTLLEQVPDFDNYDRRFVCWSPMAEAFELLAEAFDPNIDRRINLRWVWISTGVHVKMEYPYIYLLWSDATAKPSVINPEGNGGMIHDILKDKSPEILWNYTHNDLWKLPRQTREKFALEARADLFPHMMYMPMLDMDRLAAQITFGPSDNMSRLFAAGSRLVNIAQVALLSGFQELIFRSLQNLLFEFPSFSGRRSDFIPMMRSLLQFVNESCPVPRMNVVEDKSLLLKFVPSFPCFISNRFAAHGNEAIKQALHVDKTKSQTENLIRFGSTMMTVVHTHKRPLQHMQSYVQEISKLTELPPHIVKDTADMRSVLERAVVFVNLDIEAHRAVFKKHETILDPGIGTPSDNATAEDVLRLFQEVGYDSGGLKPNANGYFPISAKILDPIHGQNVALKLDMSTGYPAAVGPIALVTAELINNAAKYLSDATELAGQAAVEVSFRESEILVANDIVLGDKERVQLRLETAIKTFGGSLNRAKQWANLTGFDVDWKFPVSTRLEFAVSFI